MEAGVLAGGERWVDPVTSAGGADGERETRVRCNCVGRCPGRDWVRWGSYEASFSFWEERGGTETSGSDWRQTRRVSPVNQSGTTMDTTSREVGCGPCASPYLSVSCVFPSWERVLVFGETGGPQESRAWAVGSCQSSVTARHGEEKRKYSACGQERRRSTAGGSNIHPVQETNRPLCLAASQHCFQGPSPLPTCHSRPCHACPLSRLLDPKPKRRQGQTSAVLQNLADYRAES